MYKSALNDYFPALSGSRFKAQSALRDLLTNTKPITHDQLRSDVIADARASAKKAMALRASN
jgi:hypothetical protein|tara:strand:+ start:870 stop:1055 length:186 start_codon:yes stop_codon:yes gene_type:complete